MTRGILNDDNMVQHGRGVRQIRDADGILNRIANYNHLFTSEAAGSSSSRITQWLTANTLLRIIIAELNDEVNDYLLDHQLLQRCEETGDLCVTQYA